MCVHKEVSAEIMITLSLGKWQEESWSRTEDCTSVQLTPLYEQLTSTFHIARWIVRHQLEVKRR